MLFPLLIVCAVVLGQATAQNTSTAILDFISVISGARDNRAQVEAGSAEFDLVEVKYRQVYIPVLREKTVLFTETAINGIVLALNIMVVTQDNENKNIIYMTPYNFTDPRKYKPGELKVDDLYNLTLNDLHREADCVDSFVRLHDGIFSGINFICPIKINGRHPGLAVTMTCGDCSSVFPHTVPIVRATSVPYVFRLIGPRYRPINAPADYVSPCEKRNT